MKDGFVGFVLRPSLRTKLLAAFLVIEILLVSVGVIGLLSLREADQRANQVVALQHKIEAYRQVQQASLSQDGHTGTSSGPPTFFFPPT